MTLGIIITTYQKSDGSTPSYLSKALNSIKNQSYKNYKVFLIGDKYEDHNEFISISNSSNLGDKIFSINLPYAKEREKYPMGTKELWSSGGVNARNIGIEEAKKQGINYICHLDHDDYWHPQHLELISHAITQTQTPAIIHTCSTYFNSHLPNIELDNQIYEIKIHPGKLIHSSVCINYDKLPLKYRDVFEITGKEYAADADLWERINKLMSKDKTLKAYLISSLTCFHPVEGETLKLK